MSLAVNHVAVSVTDIRRAMEWYRDVLGMTTLCEPVQISSAGGLPEREGGTSAEEPQTDPHLADLVKQVFGPRMKKFLICHMTSSNGVGIELFQFLDPPAAIRQDNFEYWKTGYFHIAITDSKVAELAEKIAANGGRKRTEVLELVQGGSKQICFCEDPFGNIIEIYSHSYEQFWANVQM
jgi:catechol 2,3-dioxygenase-like lactoylglutathione lyase family enzyme